MGQYHRVYRLVNHTKKEVYHGTTKNPAERIKAHCNNNTKTIAHWDCRKDNIKGKWVSKHTKQSNASSKAHDLED